MSPVRTVLAFDFGLRRIGVAVGQSVTASASPLGVIANRAQSVDHDAIAGLIEEWRPDEIVVGMPSHSDGSASALQPAVEAFIDDLQRYGLRVATIDERFTSLEAQQSLKAARAAGKRGRITKPMIDSAAAVLIAERYLSSG